MGGREGLVDTAVKTAETGYMQRRLVKSLEDLCVTYDRTVRTSAGEIVAFEFGDDGLDPSMMEAKDGSVLDLSHIWNSIRATVPISNMIDELSPPELKAFIRSALEKEFSKEIKNFLSHKQRELVENASRCKKDEQDALPEPKVTVDDAFLCKDETPFWKTLAEYLYEKIDKCSAQFELKTRCRIHVAPKKVPANCKKCKAAKLFRKRSLEASYPSCPHILSFISRCAYKWRRAFTEPGTAVGAVAATSIGEPSTQMTLKTFHFAGVASMNITQGVPRIKEIINAVASISTPVITAALQDEFDGDLARRCKARIEKTTLGEISEYIEIVIAPSSVFIVIKLSAQRIRLLRLEVTPDSIVSAILSAKYEISLKPFEVDAFGKTIILIRPSESSKMSRVAHLQYLKRVLPSVIIKGSKTVSRCVIHVDETKGNSHRLIVEGTDYLGVMCTMGINPLKTFFNNALVVAQVLGIEAARTTIISEILATMESHGISLDPRHVMLLADIMTYRGEVLGITRNGLVKMKESVLLLASFERTTDHLFDAAFYGQKDDIKGVSESIILGTPIRIGTGMHKLLYRHPTQVTPTRLTTFSELLFDSTSN